ncbi:MAG: hypothetical protein IJL32_08390 [Oscillospiraceae bacterium]|nr:hypothetical protein [Oscillospiraceae bacterium]
MSIFDFEASQPQWNNVSLSGYQQNNPTGFPVSPVMPSPYGGGTESNSFRWRDACRPAPEMRNCARTYDLDALQNAWFELQSVNGNPRKRIPLTNGFTISQVVVITDPDRGSVRGAVVSYSVDAAYTAYIPADDYINERFTKHFDHVQRLPGCTKSQANDLIGLLLANAPTITITVFPRQGFIPLADGTVVFAANPNASQIPQDLISESLRVRLPMSDSTALIPSERLWQAVDALHPLIRLLLLQRVGSLLMFWLEPIRVRSYSLLIVTPSAGVSEEKLGVLLSTNDTQLHRIPGIESSRKVLLNELNLVWDGIAVFTDSSFADESDKIEEPLRLLIKEAGGGTGNGRNSIALISRFAPYAVQRIAAENVLSVSMEGVALDLDCGIIRQIVQALDAVVIQTMQRIPEQERRKYLDNCKALPPYWQQFFDRPVSDSAALFMSAEKFLEEFCQHGLLSDDELKVQLGAIYQVSRSAVSADQMMIQDFASILSESIRNGEIAAVQKQQKVRIDPKQDTILVDGDHFYICGGLVDSILRSAQTAHMRSSLLAALRQNDLLHATDGQTKPIQVYDLTGKSQRLYWYCMDASMLDDDMLHLLHNIDSEQFWLAPDEIPERDFIPLLCDASGRVAGKLLRQNAGKIIVISTASGSSERGDQLIDMLLETLLRYQREQPGIPLDLVLDEVQNQNFAEGSPICRILKEGRRSLISFIGSTQDYYPSNTELGKAMGKADTQLILRPTQNSESAVAAKLRFKKGDTARFDSMQRGDAIIKTAFYSKKEGRNIQSTLSGQLASFIEDDSAAPQNS